MSRLGDLTISGLLYEGNFSEWTPRIDAILRMRNMSKFTYQILSQMRSTASSIIATQSTLAAGLICSHISPALLKLIPEDNGWHPLVLFKFLEELCQPFPLMELPPEVRLIIYRNCFKDQGGKVIADESTCVTKDPIPAVLQTTRVIRSEARVAYFSTSTFIVPDARRSERELDISAAIGAWIENVVGDAVQHLTRVRLHKLFYNEEDQEVPRREAVSVCIGFSDTRGLVITVKDGALRLEGEAIRRVVEHLARNETQRKLLRLRGESIVTTLLSRPELWCWGALKYKLTS